MPRAQPVAASPRRNCSPVPAPAVLVVDDEPLIRATLAEFLEQEGYRVSACADGEAALELAGRQLFDVALCDVQLPGLDGIELLDRLLKINPEIFVLLITAYATVDNAVEAFHRGAHDYLMKPVLLDDVSNKLRRLIAFRDLHRENQWLRRQLHREEDSHTIVGHSAAMRHVLELARKVAPTRSTVLLQGESGTGKELIAWTIHQQASSRESDLFLAVNCAAIPNDLLENQLFGHRKGAFTGADRDQSGVFVHAGRGTVFLDEIAELSSATQAKLLRAIEQKEILPVGANEPIHVQARIVAATNKDLRREMEEGRFRDDLFYRLNVVTITIPPLRERREDIPELVDHLLARHARSLGKHVVGVSNEAMQLLRGHYWRGNVRELENVLQRAVILGDGPLITPVDLSPDLVPLFNDPSQLEELSAAVKFFEKQHIERVMRQAPDKKEAARRLGMGLSSLYRKIAELEIEM